MNATSMSVRVNPGTADTVVEQLGGMLTCARHDNKPGCHGLPDCSTGSVMLISLGTRDET